MSDTLKPGNLTAQLHWRGEGNPYSVLPRSAISNCFPGLEFDFRNLWRRTFEGIVLVENNNYVVEAEDPVYADLVTRRLVRVDGFDTMVLTTGLVTVPQNSPHDSWNVLSTSPPSGISTNSVR